MSKETYMNQKRLMLIQIEIKKNHTGRTYRLSEIIIQNYQNYLGNYQNYSGND